MQKSGRYLGDQEAMCGLWIGKSMKVCQVEVALVGGLASAKDNVLATEVMS